MAYQKRSSIDYRVNESGSWTANKWRVAFCAMVALGVLWAVGVGLSPTRVDPALAAATLENEQLKSQLAALENSLRSLRQDLAGAKEEAARAGEPKKRPPMTEWGIILRKKFSETEAQTFAAAANGSAILFETPDGYQVALGANSRKEAAALRGGMYGKQYGSSPPIQLPVAAWGCQWTANAWKCPAALE